MNKKETLDGILYTCIIQYLWLISMFRGFKKKALLGLKLFQRINSLQLKQGIWSSSC